VVFIGDCATWKGQLGGKPVQIENVYQPRETKSPYHAEHEDIYAKMLAVTSKMAAHRNDTHVRLTGCPVSVAEQVLALAFISGAKNPYFEKTEILKFNKAYLAWRAANASRRIRGKPYQVAGPTERGDGAPTLSGS
jgi:hypothetical protein